MKKPYGTRQREQAGQERSVIVDPFFRMPKMGKGANVSNNETDALRTELRIVDSDRAESSCGAIARNANEVFWKWNETPHELMEHRYRWPRTGYL